MAEPADIKKPFGQKEPPLTDQIVNILGRYPDGGQILKELIQNADDAGAKEVKFLYDGRSFGKKYLATEHLQKYQGPALYTFNDAIFKPEDWEGIQNLMRSNKKSDLLKVGRFGIGFNSVYHIT
ncbi:sacsin isoform X1, partial [Paramuricea clavata]